jgi:hypothetical protein
MSGGNENGLTDELLHGVAHMCTGLAVRTYMNEFLPGGLRPARAEIHARRRRFEEAREKLKSGMAFQELGLSSEDLAWVADKINPAKDHDELKVLFQTLAEEMKKHEEAKTARMI